MRLRKLATGPIGAMSAYQGLQSRLLLLALITISIYRTKALDTTCFSNSGALVSLPGQPDWQTDKSVFNSKINKLPLAVVYAQTEAQVQETIRCASSAGIRVVPRGGGHAYEGMLCTILRSSRSLHKCLCKKFVLIHLARMSIADDMLNHTIRPRRLLCEHTHAMQLLVIGADPLHMCRTAWSAQVCTDPYRRFAADLQHLHLPD